MPEGKLLDDIERQGAKPFELPELTPTVEAASESRATASRSVAPPGTSSLSTSQPQAATAVVAAAPPARASAVPLALAQPLVIGDAPMLREPRLTRPTQPYRPDTVVDGGEAHGMVVRAGSVRGRDKRDDGGPRQDDFCLSIVDERKAVVIAVADGMGSAKRAHLGAVLATRHAVEEIETQLADRPPNSIDWPGLFQRAARALVVEHCNDRDSDEDHVARDVSRDLGTTLTVAVVWAETGMTKYAVSAMGDSPAWLLTDERWHLLLGDVGADESFEDTSVVALPYVGTPQHRSGILSHGQVLVVATDGFGRPLDDGRNDLGLAFAGALASPPPLASWGQLVDFGRRTYSDDRTIAAVWPAPAP